LTRHADVRIDRIAAGGDGVGRDDGLVVFIPRTAPGDLVDAEIVHREGERFGRGVLRRVIEGSAARVTPPCDHYVQDGCGGCQLQHLSYDAQVHAKGSLVAEAFRRIAKREVHTPVVHASPKHWRYRRKITVHLRRDAGAPVTTPWRAGLHPHDDPATVFSLGDCRITEERVVQAMHALVAVADAWPDAVALRVAVRLLEDGVAVVVEGGTRWDAPESLADHVASVRAIWWVPERGTRRLVVDRRDASAPGASFVQVNAEVADALRAHVIARAMSFAPRRVIDGYAGAGDTAVALMDRGVRVTAIELDAEASAHAATRLRAPSRAVTSTVEDALRDALPADVVILNPPRAGVHERVLRTLREARPAPRAILYVSCDPATLARDVGRLNGWRVADVTCFDMFPQTAHVETVCELVPGAA
jgi:23S rRNA (uracil1939-C5)-methyltransferase